MYPDGIVTSSRSSIPSLQVEPADPVELGENAKWLQKEFREKWKAENEAKRSKQNESGGGESSSKR